MASSLSYIWPSQVLFLSLFVNATGQAGFSKQSPTKSLDALLFPDPAGAPLPITETGFRSHYCQPEELEAYNYDPAQYMRAALNHYAQTPEWKRQQNAACQYAFF